jgi:membrane protein YdbS with pleckstrin-like domain
MMRVDHKGLDPEAAQLVERESDERLLKDRNERLRQNGRQRTQPRAQPSAKDEGLCDHARANGVVGRDSVEPRLTPARRSLALPELVLDRRSDKTGAMTEEPIWRGTSSQLKNLGLFILCGLFCWLIVPIFIALTRYLQTKNNVFELTSERLKITEGVFSKITETLELYRVKDIEVRQPFIYRMLGVENIQVNTSDMSSPVILLQAIPKAVGLPDKLRNQVEIIRVQKKVREIDLE